MNKNIYKDEFGQYHEVDEEVETPLDGFEDDEHDQYEEIDELDDPFDSVEDDNDYDYDEDEAYANERRSEYDSEED
jgi:hypothetical protein